MLPSWQMIDVVLLTSRVHTAAGGKIDDITVVVGQIVGTPISDEVVSASPDKAEEQVSGEEQVAPEEQVSGEEQVSTEEEVLVS